MKKYKYLKNSVAWMSIGLLTLEDAVNSMNDKTILEQLNKLEMFISKMKKDLESNSI